MAEGVDALFHDPVTGAAFEPSLEESLDSSAISFGSGGGGDGAGGGSAGSGGSGDGGMASLTLPASLAASLASALASAGLNVGSPAPVMAGSPGGRAGADEIAAFAAATGDSTGPLGRKKLMPIRQGVHSHTSAGAAGAASPTDNASVGTSSVASGSAGGGSGGRGTSPTPAQARYSPSAARATAQQRQVSGRGGSGDGGASSTRSAGIAIEKPQGAPVRESWAIGDALDDVLKVVDPGARVGSTFRLEVLSRVAGLKFSRNNGRNSKNIQGFPGEAVPRPAGGPLTPIRIRVTAASQALLESIQLCMSIVPATRIQTSAWLGHACTIGSSECRQPPVWIGEPDMTTATGDGVVEYTFLPQRAWSYNHAMKKNLGKKHELHALKFSIFREGRCVFDVEGPIFELENKKRDQWSRKKRLLSSGSRPRGDRGSVGDSSDASDSVGGAPVATKRKAGTGGAGGRGRPPRAPGAAPVSPIDEGRPAKRRPITPAGGSESPLSEADVSMSDGSHVAVSAVAATAGEETLMTDDFEAFRFLDDPNLMFLRNARGETEVVERGVVRARPPPGYPVGAGTGRGVRELDTAHRVAHLTRRAPGGEPVPRSIERERAGADRRRATVVASNAEQARAIARAKARTARAKSVGSPTPSAPPEDSSVSARPVVSAAASDAMWEMRLNPMAAYTADNVNPGGAPASSASPGVGKGGATHARHAVEMRSTSGGYDYPDLRRAPSGGPRKSGGASHLSYDSSGYGSGPYDPAARQHHPLEPGVVTQAHMVQSSRPPNEFDPDASHQRPFLRRPQWLLLVVMLAGMVMLGTVTFFVVRALFRANQQVSLSGGHHPGDGGTSYPSGGGSHGGQQGQPVHDVDCVVSEWSVWGECCRVEPSQPASQERRRFVVKPPDEGGERCPAVAEVRMCHSQTQCPDGKLPPPPMDNLVSGDGSAGGRGRRLRRVPRHSDHFTSASGSPPSHPRYGRDPSSLGA